MKSAATPGTITLGDSLGPVVGGKTATALRDAFAMRTVADLLAHYPRRHLARGEMSDLGSLTVGEHVTVFAEVVSVKTIPMSKPANRQTSKRPRVRVEIVITDGRGAITLVFFGQAWRDGQCRPGRRGLFAGTVSMFRNTKQLTHPDLLILPEDVADPDEHEAARFFTSRMVPIYPASAKVASWRVSNAISHVLDGLALLDDPVPAEVREAQDLIGLRQALEWIHRPETQSEYEAAVQRLRFDEAFALQMVLAQRRVEWRSLTAIPRTRSSDGLLTIFDQQNAFTLTGAQERVGQEIFADLAADHPMHRLLQGDVGSGKTLVALRAMLAVVDAGGQAALIAPTEVLAQQHAATIRGMLGPLAQAGTLTEAEQATSVQLLTGSLSTSQRRTALAEIADGSAGIVIGTHALFEQSVVFKELGLVVIDEQHRFGVEQRAVLNQPLPDGSRPHILVMTATPIPRTVAMTVFGDLAVSVLDELPRGRQPIATHVVSRLAQPRHVNRMWERAREEVAAGHKVYVVCPRIGVTDSDEGTAPEVSTVVPSANVMDTAAELADSLLPDLLVGILHGRLTSQEKADAMRRFASSHDVADRLDLLVATTVIEVGVDVPAATMMIILDADRFGISQLHQLRGRIGRGSAPSVCILVSDAAADSPARKRLEAVAATTDGFELAQVDLQSRREGDVLGAAQSGNRSSLRLLEVVRDEEVIAAARVHAEGVLASDPHLEHQPALRNLIGELRREERSDYLHKG